MFRTQNLCPGSKNVFDSRQKHFQFPSSEICFRNNLSLFSLTDLFRLSITSHVTISRKAFSCKVGLFYACTQTTKVETRSPRYRHMICIGKQNRQAKRVYLTTFAVILNAASNNNLHFLHLGALKCFVHV